MADPHPHRIKESSCCLEDSCCYYCCDSLGLLLLSLPGRSKLLLLSDSCDSLGLLLLLGLPGGPGCSKLLLLLPEQSNTGSD